MAKDFRGWTDERTGDGRQQIGALLVPERLLSLGRLLAGEWWSAGGAGVRFEPEIAGHVVPGLRQYGYELPAVGGPDEFLERHAQSGLDADRVRVIVVIVVHDRLW